MTHSFKYCFSFISGYLVFRRSDVLLVPVLLLCSLSVSSSKEIYLGKFEVTTHLVQGQIYYDVDRSTLTLKRFYYDGEGPGPIQFVVVPRGEDDYASSGTPLDILQQPSDIGKNAERTKSTEGPVLSRNVTLLLEMPIRDVGRIVVWCPLYEVCIMQTLGIYGPKSANNATKSKGTTRSRQQFTNDVLPMAKSRQSLQCIVSC